MKYPNVIHVTCPCCSEALIVKLETEATTCDPEARNNYNKRVARETMDKYGIDDGFVRTLIEKHTTLIEPVRTIRDTFGVGLVKAKYIFDAVREKIEQETKTSGENPENGGGI